MDEILTVKDVASYLKLNERTVLKYASENQLPAVKVGGQWRFKREVLDRWLESRMSGGSQEADQTFAPIRVASLLRPDMILPNVSAENGREVLEQIVQACVRSGQITDERALLGALRRREELCSTALGQGVAFPHVREGGLRLADVPVVVLARVPEGVEFGAADGGLTHVFFMVYAPSVKLHLRILARLSQLLRDKSLVGRLIGAPDGEAMVAALREAEINTDDEGLAIATDPEADSAGQQQALSG